MKFGSCLESSWDNRNQTGGARVLSGWSESPPGLPGTTAPAWCGTPCSLCLFIFFKLSDIEDLMKRENQKILTPLVSLDTPGKATVQVIILADPVSITQEGDRLPQGFLLRCLSAKFLFSLGVGWTWNLLCGRWSILKTLKDRSREKQIIGWCHGRRWKWWMVCFTK